MHLYTNTDLKITSAVMKTFGETLENAMKSAGPIDTDLTLAAWKQGTVRYHNALSVIRKENDMAVEEIGQTYSPQYAAERIKTIRTAWGDGVKIVIDMRSSQLQKVMAAKRQALSNSMTVTDEQTRLLQVYALRSSVPADEIAILAEKMAGSIPALAALGEIAKRSGVPFPEISVERARENLARAEQFALERLEAIGKSPDDMTYRERLFFSDQPGEAAFFFGDVDASPFTAALKKALPAFDETKAQEAPAPVPKPKTFDERFAEAFPALGRYTFMSQRPGCSYHNCTRVTIREGQTIADLLSAFNVTRSELLNANPQGLDFDNLRAGQKIEVPSCTLWDAKKATAITPDQCETFEVPLTE